MQNMVRILSNSQNERSKHYENVLVNNREGEDVFMLESDVDQLQSEGLFFLLKQYQNLN